MTDGVTQLTEMTGAVAQHVSILGLVANADVIVKLVMLLLLVASFVCWAIIFEKWIAFRNLRYRTSKFEKLFASAASLDQILVKTRKKLDNPMASLFVVAMRELQEECSNGIGKQTIEVKATIKEKIFQALYATKNRAISRLEKHLIFLATVGSSAPFVGLFGTVWGIMNSFQAISATKNTTLAVVAPGIAEALLATAIGLFAAIPAVIAYNFLSNQIRVYAGRVEDFLGQLAAIIAHEMEANHIVHAKKG